MRILHVDTEKSWRGGEQQLMYLVQGLKGRGCSSAVACRSGKPLEARSRERGIDTLPLTGNQLIDSFKLAIVGRDFDIIHAHAANAHTVSVVSKRFHGRPVVYTRRVDFVPKANKLTKLKYSLTDGIVAITNEVRKILVTAGVDGRKIRVINSVVDEGYEQRVDKGTVASIREQFGGGTIVGAIGALTEQKNHFNFIDAAERVLAHKKDCVFLIIGEGHLEERLRERIRSRGLDERVRLIGFKEDIQNYLKALDILVMSSDYEGMGSIILAAMMVRVPVVSTDAGGAKEIVIQEETGLLVPRKQPSALGDAILKVVSDEDLRKRIVEGANRFVKERFTVPRMVDAYLDLYHELLSSSPGGRDH